MAVEDKKVEPKVEPKVERPKKVTEATYTIPELVAAASAEFGTKGIVVAAALRKAGKEAYTLREAKQLVERMKKKEVKA